MITSRLVDTVHGYTYSSSVIELDQLWLFTDGNMFAQINIKYDPGNMFAQINIKYDPEGATMSSATALLFDNDGKQMDLTFRDFPSRWWDTVRRDMGPYPGEVPSQSMVNVALALRDRIVTAFTAAVDTDPDDED